MKTKKILSALILSLSLLLLTGCNIDSVISAAGLEPPSRQTEQPSATELPGATAQPEPTAEVTPEPEPEIYVVRLPETAFRMAPKTEESNVMRTLDAGTELRCLGSESEFLYVELADGSQGWCNGWYLRAKDEALEAQREEEYLSDKTSSATFVPIEGEPV